MFEERLHGVMIGFGQLSDQILDGLNALPVVIHFCRRKDQSQMNRLHKTTPFSQAVRFNREGVGETVGKFSKLIKRDCCETNGNKTSV